MAYYDEAFAWDWSLPSDQFSTGLDVQLPGHDLLLPFQDGYLAKPSTILGPTITKCLPEENHLNFDLVLDEEGLICFDSMVPDAGDELNILDESFNPGEYLPSSPETACVDLSQIDISQAAAVQASVVVPEISECDARHTKELSGVSAAESVQGGQLDDGSHEFDPTWLMPATIPTLPSLEELESLLSASPEPVVGPPAEESKQASDGVWIDGFCLNENMYGSYLSTVQNAMLVSQPVVESVNQFPVIWHGNGHVLNSGNQVPSFIVSKTFVDVGSMSPSESNLSSSPSPSYDSECDSRVGTLVSSGRGYADRFEPYPATDSVKPERRERKREQNKTAALKYRQKKRTEQGSSKSECDQLEKRNGELKSRVEELTREINYLKGLISEIYSCEKE